jgi:pimeloyl-ACP methyl ester carboxylesterase
MSQNFLRHAILAVAAIFVAAIFISPTAANSRVKIQFAQVGEIKMAYYTRGQGEPLFLINGFMSAMSTWDPALLDVLAKNNKLIIFDNRGVGLSTDTKDDKTSMEQMADDTAGLIKALGYKKANVLGYSMGARIAQQVFIRHPDLVNKGILAAPNPGGSRQIKPSAEVAKLLNDPNVSTYDKASLMFTKDQSGQLALKQIMQRINNAIKNGTAPNDNVVSKETALRQDRARTTLWGANEKNFDDLKNIKFPVLVADGRDDVIDPPENARLIAGQIPFSWLTFYEGGHGFLFQSATRFGATINAFLK